jgi:type IV pilus assembly protein PilY1
VASVDNNPLVIVGTGRYLGLSDLPDTTTYSMYAIHDKLNVGTALPVTLPSPRESGSQFVAQIMTGTTCPADAPTNICNQGQTVRTSTSNAVDFGTKNGWYFDFLIGGERAVTDPSLALGTLVFTTIKPQAATAATVMGCTGEDAGVNAKSYLYYLNFLTGSAVEGTQNVVGEELCVCIATRPSVVRTQSGNVEGIIRMSGGGQSEGTDMGVTRRENLPTAPPGSPSRRISWRELNGE